MVLSLLIAGLWASSIPFHWGWTWRGDFPYRQVDVYGGAVIAYGAYVPGNTEGWHVWRRTPEDYRYGSTGHIWRPYFVYYASNDFLRIVIPFWIPFLLTTVPAAILWLRDRATPSHCCQTCAYDLTGNTSGVCPECGNRI